MALPITTASDYTGKVRISTSKGTQFSEYITEYERKYLRLVLGDECYNDIKTATNPLAQKYLDLFNGVNYTNTSGDFIAFQGFKESLIRFVYSEYNTDSFQTSIGGNVKSVNENSTLLTSGNTILLAQRFNEGVIKYIDETYPFLLENEELSLTPTNSISGGAVSTIEVPSTKYLSDGDTVTILGIDYTISTVVTDTSFVITTAEATGYFAGLAVTYNPFYEVKFNDFNKYSII
jgi:hypothetical protein